MYLPPVDFITTKEAAKRSGYTSDYLARLARSGEIVGRQVGRAWLVSVDSLQSYLSAQEDRNTVRARALARARANEYQMARAPARHIADILPAHRSLGEVGKKTVDISGLPPRKISTVSHAFALAVACVVVAGSAFLAHASFIPELAARTGALAEQVSIGLEEMLGDVPSRFIARVDAVHEDAMRAQTRVLDELAQLSARIALPSLTSPDLSLSQLALSLPSTSSTIAPHRYADTPVVPVPALSNPRIEVPSALTLDDVAIAVHAVIALARDPVLAIPAFESGYRAVGVRTLALGASMRDELAALPRALVRADIVIGELAIEAAHAAIDADVSTAYGLSAAGPASARVAMTFVGGIGEATLHIARAVPGTASALYMHAAAMPAHIAPTLAHAVWAAEYAAITRFLAATDALENHYLALVNGTGRTIYAAASGGRTLMVATLPAAFENASLAAFGHLALTWNTFSTAEWLNTLGNRLASIPAISRIAATAAPTMTAGEQTALFTYTTIHTFFDSTNRLLASLFAPAPTIIVVTSSPSSKDSPSSKISSGPSAQPAATPPSVRPQIVYQSPSYNTTTVVKGVSLDLLNQSLASLRSDLSNQMAILIQPVAGQVATNVTTIQQVNMIQDLSNLIVRNGDFRGGTFDNGRLTNGISVSATTGSFSTLTGGSLTANALTLTNQLTVGNGGTGATTFGQGWLHSSGGTNALTSSTSPTVAYLVATSTTLASQFPYASTTALSASGLTSGRVTYAGTGGILQNSTNLTFDGTNLGIGTSTPQWLLNPASSTAAQLALSAGVGFSQWAFRNAGGIFYLATTSVVGTATSTSAALTIDANGLVTQPNGLIISAGNVGIGTTSPYANLSIQGSGSANSTLFAVGSSTSVGPLFSVSNGGSVNIGAASANPTLQPAHMLGIGLIGTTQYTDPGNFNAIDVEPFIVYNTAPSVGGGGFDTDIGFGGSANVPTFVGVGSYPYYKGTGVVTTLAGFDTNPYINTTGTVTSVYGFRDVPVGYGDGSISNNYGLFIGNLNGTASTTYGVYTSSTAGATNYALYNAGTAKSYFAGNLGIGTTTPNWSLQIAAAKGFLALSDTGATANLKHWTLSSQQGAFFIATSSDALATSTGKPSEYVSINATGNQEKKKVWFSMAHTDYRDSHHPRLHRVSHSGHWVF